MNVKLILKYKMDYVYNSLMSDICFSTDSSWFRYRTGAIILKDGKTIKRIDTFDDNFKGPGDIFLRNNNELVINCSINAEEIRAVVNLKDYSITYENIEE